MGRIEVSALPEELILNYINEVVKGSKQIGVIYEDNFRISDVYERFIVSVKENINNEIGVIT
jgi:alkyl sulfatase BDS1-like metallo-beta-lactamase superfamily hydrolase